VSLNLLVAGKSSSSLNRDHVVGPDLSSVRVVVGAGRSTVGVVDGWWFREALYIGGGVSVGVVLDGLNVGWRGGQLDRRKEGMNHDFHRGSFC
jgi:hypothetical protein